jgi:hypothetical protein
MGLAATPQKMTEYIAILKAKVSALSEARMQNESDLDSVIQKRSQSTDPVEQRAFTSQAASLLSEQSRITRELHMTRRLLARTEGDEFDFGATAT